MNMPLVLRLPRCKTLTFCSLLIRCTNPLRLPRETTSERPKVVRTCGVFNILTWKCVARHYGVHFYNTKSGPNMWCFVHFDLEMCFAPQRRAIFHLSSPEMASRPPLKRAYLSNLHLLSSDSFSSRIFSSLLWLFPPLLCHLSILSEVWLLDF